jgi:DNA invertase Pin-like site-specific DNA recombinase
MQRKGLDMNHVYLRVSTAPQDAASQASGIAEYCDTHGLLIDATTSDTASGAVSWRERQLYQLLSQCEAGDIIIVAEVSRIGRSTVDVLDFFREATARQVKTIATKSGLVVGDDLQSKITTTVLALAAEIEREFLLARTAEGYARARAAGVRVGRPPGATSPGKVSAKESEIAALLKAGVSQSAIARLLGVSRGTILRQILRMKIASAEKND